MQVFAILLGVLLSISTSSFAQENLIIERGLEGCSSSEESAEELERMIGECSEELEGAIMEGLDKTMQHGLFNLRRKRQVAVSVSGADRRMSGCLLQCLFRKFNILEEDGIPSRTGILTLVTDGVTDRRYFRTASKSLDRCYHTYRDFRHSHHKNVSGAYHCDMAYDVFECITQDIQEYCDSQIKK